MLIIPIEKKYLQMARIEWVEGHRRFRIEKNEAALELFKDIEKQIKELEGFRLEDLAAAERLLHEDGTDDEDTFDESDMEGEVEDLKIITEKYETKVEAERMGEDFDRAMAQAEYEMETAAEE
jgi:hypothetical protein